MTATDVSAPTMKPVVAGLDTCRPCLERQHHSCWGMAHRRREIDEGRGCICSICHPQRRAAVLFNRNEHNPVLPQFRNKTKRRAGGRPKTSCLDEDTTLRLRVLWIATADPERWTEATFQLLADWRKLPLTWNQIEQITCRVHCRAAWSRWSNGGKNRRLQPAEDWDLLF